MGLFGPSFPRSWVQRLAVLLEVGIQIQGGDTGAVVGSAQVPAGTASSELGVTY